MSLSARRVVPERMDAPDLAPNEHRRALDGLSRLNAVSGPTARLSWPVAALCRTLGRPVRVLDVACGGGDGVVELARWAKRAGHPVEVAGCDRSRTALDRAAELAAACSVPASFHRCDVLADPLPPGFDVVTCSLFLHHLDDTDAVTLLRAMRDAAGSVVVVNDLVRGRWNLLLVWLGSRLLSRSPVVHFDAPASVRAAFIPAELRQLAKAAGLDGAAVRRVFPCRMVLTWERL